MAIETENRMQALGAFLVNALGPPPIGVETPVNLGDGMTSFTRNAIGDYTVLVDEPMESSQTLIQNLVSGGKANVAINAANPRQLDVLVFDRGGGFQPALADLDFRIEVFQVPRTG